MRNQQNMINTFMPMHEKEWESRLFIDEAIKGKAEYHLEAIARALAGKNEIRFDVASKEKPHIVPNQIKTDSGRYVTVTNKYLYSVSVMNAFHVYANSMTEVWIEIIKGYAGASPMVFPCGGAFFPNREFEVSRKEDK